MKARPFKRYVYALFHPDGRCHYVGQTRNPKDRAACHRRKRGDSFTFKILAETCDPSLAVALENQHITNFRGDGHPIINRAWAVRPSVDYDSRQIYPRFERVDSGELFETTQHIAICFQLHQGTVRNAFHGLSPGQFSSLYIDGKNVRFKLLH